ncbi:MAG TPA: T9SS type A sorting domain-containing protein [Patescibacteria group bacterium]|nr:T9SS type A sorting domain-containing protein [Patescibacteria group bacterium]
MLSSAFKKLLLSLVVSASAGFIPAWAQVQITAPKSAEVFKGKDVKIRWSGANGSPVGLFYSTDGGASWTLIADRIMANEYLWTIPSLTGKILLKAESQNDATFEQIWEIKADHPETFQYEIRAGVFSPDGSTILTASSDNELKFWNIAAQTHTGLTFANVARVVTPHFLHDDNTIVCGADSAIIIFKRNISQQTILGKGSFTSAIRAIAIHPYKNIVAAAEVNGFVRVWDLDTRQQLTVFGEPEFSVYSVAFSPDGETIAYAGDNSSLLKSKIYLGNWQDASRIAELDGHGEAGQNRTVWSLHFSPDGKRLVSGGVDKTLRVWNIAERREEMILKGHNFHVRSVRFSPDGRRIISGSLDSTMRQWDWQRGVEFGQALHMGQVLAVDYSPTGDTIFTTGRDRTMKLWRTTEALYSFDTTEFFLRTDTLLVQDTACAGDKRDADFGEKTSILVISPNPASNLANITFTLAEDGQISLKIFDIQGNLIRTFFTESFKSGRFERDLNLSGIPNGAYIIRLETPSRNVDMRISIVK